MARKRIPDEALIGLRQRLELLPIRNAERRREIKAAADLFGVSVSTLYRSLRSTAQPRALRRRDCGTPRVLPRAELERYCEVIAALKVRTSNKKGRCLSTIEAIRLLEQFGVETPDGLLKADASRLKRSTVNRYLRLWGYDAHTLGVQQVVRRFEAQHSNECWQFDLSPSDLKSVEELPPWTRERGGKPVLMLYSVVDDRSGVAYQEYHVVYGEDVSAALRFLFRAMTPKDVEGFAFQGRPQMLYMDNGPIAKSRLFRRVMEMLQIEVRCHLPRGKGGRRVTSRAKGKVERPFRTVKEVHETLYHFHKPRSQEEANQWLMTFLLRYNEQAHRSEPHSRLEDWLKALPSAGLREMCSWDRMCTFAREPEQRTVGPDARVSVGGTYFQVDDELASHKVTLWWGLLDEELFVEWGERRYGPYQPAGGPIPLHQYRAPRKTQDERRADRIEALASQLALPAEVFTLDPRAPEALRRTLPADVPVVAFRDPDPFHQLEFPSVLAAKRAIATEFGRPLARLTAQQREQIDQLVSGTLDKGEVIKTARQILSESRDAQPQQGEE